MTFPRMALAVLALAAALAAPRTADASGDGRVLFRFARGATCWAYTGRAWEFTGRFDKGQTVTVRATGLAAPGDGGRTREVIQPRFPTLRRHHGDAVDGQDGVFAVPDNGIYDIVLWPHVMQGGRVTIRICAR